MQCEGTSLLIMPKLRGCGTLPIVKLKISKVRSGNRQTNNSILEINSWQILLHKNNFKFS